MTKKFLVDLIVVGLALIFYALFILGLSQKVYNEVFIKYFSPIIIFLGFLQLSEFLVSIIKLIIRILK